MPALRNTLSCTPRIGSTGNASPQSTDTSNLGPVTQSRSPDIAERSSSKRKSTYTTYSLRQKLELLDYVKAHSEADASRHFGIPRTTLRVGKGLKLHPGQNTSRSLKGKHACRGAGRPLTYGEDVEQLIVQWILEARNLQLPVQKTMI